MLLVKREKNQHEKMIMKLEEKAIEKHIESIKKLKQAHVLYTTSATKKKDPYILHLAQRK